jgi:hypothetical protein
MARMPSRSSASRFATIVWALLFVVVDAAWRPVWAGHVALLTVALVGAGVLWNLDALRAAWRDDQEAKRNR